MSVDVFGQWEREEYDTGLLKSYLSTFLSYKREDALVTVAWYISKALDLILPLNRDKGEGYSFLNTVFNTEGWIGNCSLCICVCVCVYVYVYTRI